MKKTITALVALITLCLIPTTNAAVLKNTTVNVPTLAILDTALDTSIPAIKSKLIGEVCILDWATCANGQKFMEGPGAASIPLNLMASRDLNHGTQMTSVAIANNPNMNILFVRIIGNTAQGKRQNTNINTVANALKWLYENKDKYNIKAVSMSQGHHNLLAKANYCPVTTTDYWVDWFLKSNIPVFFPTGNGRDKARIDWPACIPSSIAVGGAEEFDESFATSITSNYDPKLTDFWAPISYRVLFPGGAEGNGFGTSVSTQIAAAKWLSVSSSKPNLNLYQVLDLIKKTAKPITNSLNQNGIVVDEASAING